MYSKTNIIEIKKSKNIILLLISLYYLFMNQINTYASNKGLLEGVGGNIRRGDLHTEDVAGAIQGMIKIGLGIAGTISVIFVIVGAYKLLLGSLQSDHTKGRETIVMALTGFVISALAWFIVKFIFNNFG